MLDCENAVKMKSNDCLPHRNLNASDILLLYLLRHLMDSKEVLVLPLTNVPCICSKSYEHFLVSGLKQVELIEVGLLELETLLPVEGRLCLRCETEPS